MPHTTVWVLGEGDDSVLRTATDGLGRHSLDDVPEGTHHILVTARRAEPGIITVSLHGQNGRAHNFALASGTAPRATSAPSPPGNTSGAPDARRPGARQRAGCAANGHGGATARRATTCRLRCEWARRCHCQARELGADALGTPNAIGEKAHVTAFVVRRFMGCGLLVDLSASPDGTLRRPGRVHRVCRREDLADLVTPGTPLGPEQAASYRPGRPLGPIAPHVFSATRPAPDP